MGKMITGSICITDIIEQAKKGHSAFNKGKSNGKLYANLIIWENDEPDQFNNNFSVQLSATKEKRETEGKVYIGNLKYMEKTGPGEMVPATAEDANNITTALSNLPF